MTDEEREAFPEPPMTDLVAALELFRRLARSYSVTTSAEAIVQILATWPEPREQA